MLRQLIIFFAFTWHAHAVLAKPPVNNVYTVPSPQQEAPKSENKVQGSSEKNAVIESQGLDKTFVPSPALGPQRYHLAPGPSFTLAFSRAYEFSETESNNFFGLHISPWMTATSRTQFGLDVYSKTGWVQAAYHQLASRGKSRFYYGGGVSLLFQSNESLAPFSKFDNYHLFAVGGWESQVAELQSLRFEISYHHGSDTQLAKATVGYTFHY